MLLRYKEELRKDFNIRDYTSDAVNNIEMLHIVSKVHSEIPAVTHVDYSARIQTVNKLESADYYNLIAAFEKLTDCGVVVNTSFNVRGEPIVCTP